MARPDPAPPRPRRRRGERIDIFVFDVDRLTLAVPASQVLSVEDARPPVPIPRCPPHVLGVRRYQGEMLPVMSLSRFLGVEGGRPADRRSRRTVVVGAGGVRVGILCDVVQRMVETDKNDWRTPEVFVQPHIEALLLGELELEGQFVGILDLVALLEASRVR